MKTTDIGKKGEQQALRYLKRRGSRLLERNYRYGRYEIDLVMEQAGCIVFVEVKARSDTHFGTPAMAVDSRKQRYLLLAAQGYLMERRCEEWPARFDVVEVYLTENRIQHIVNAFSG